jgi:hypothetical protein
MSKILVAIAVGTFAFGMFVGHAISTAPDANATATATRASMSTINPFDMMLKSQDLPPLDFTAAF